MKNYLLLMYFSNLVKKYIFIFLTANILLFISFTKGFSKENVFTVNNVAVKGAIDINFSRDKYLNKAFLNSFKILMNKILLSKDLNKMSDIKLKQIKNLVESFQILNENYSRNEYKVNFQFKF